MEGGLLPNEALRSSWRGLFFKTREWSDLIVLRESRVGATLPNIACLAQTI
jgi:hypothetical protein